MSEFNTPLSNTEAILQNFLGAENELKEPQSNIEAMLMNELGGDWPEREPMSRVEKLTKEVLESVEPHPTLINKSITENGNYDPHDDNADGYKKVSVAVAPNVGTKNITANGDYSASADNVDGYSSVHVDVPADVAEKNISANGEYNASADNVDGYSKVTVNVAADVMEKSITTNGIYKASDDSKEGYSKVTVNVQPDLTTKTITNNGVYRAVDDSKEGYSVVTVDVDPTVPVYGFHINSAEDDSDACVTYIADAIGATPAHMDFTNDIWDWGSWVDAFFIPKPCMVLYDGTVDYYLDPNDYTKKADGTASDIADDTYGGNAMMEWPKIWMKIVPDESDDTSASVYFAPVKVDESYTCWPYINCDGDEVDHMYTAIYNGSLIDGKLRSISGQAVMYSKTAAQEISYADANNQHNKTEWNIGLFTDRVMINLLTVLITKSLDCKGKIGKGIQTGSGTAFYAYRTGALNTKGLFYGVTANESTAVKVFGIENFYALQWQRTLGLNSVSGAQKVKLCYGTADGSTTAAYNTDGTGYLTGNSTAVFSTTTGGWLKFLKFDSRGFFTAKEDSGAESKRYRAYFYQSVTANTLSLFGGASYVGARVSLFAFDLGSGASSAHWALGAFLSMKKLTA